MREEVIQGVGGNFLRAMQVFYNLIMLWLLYICQKLQNCTQKSVYFTKSKSYSKNPPQNCTVQFNIKKTDIG